MRNPIREAEKITFKGYYEKRTTEKTGKFNLIITIENLGNILKIKLPE